MFEELVSEVTGALREQPDRSTRLFLTYRHEGIIEESVLDLDEVGALSTWLAQPKPPTAEEIAAEIVEEFVNKPGQFVLRNAQGDLERRIAAALRAAKEGRNV